MGKAWAVMSMAAEPMTTSFAGGREPMEVISVSGGGGVVGTVTGSDRLAVSVAL